jgi:hypothetical protein
MVRLMQAQAFVIVSVLLGGLLGGYVGREVGRRAPSFVAMLAPVRPSELPASFRPAEYGLGLGTVSGLFFGAGTSMFVVLVHASRSAWLARGRPGRAAGSWD